MPLPLGGDKAAWPPADAAGAYMRFAEHSAWYDGSPLALAAFYGGYGGSQMGGQALGFFNQNLTYPEPTNLAAPLWRRFMFWSKQPTTPVTRFRLHVPLAADIAARSADLLFSQSPSLRIPEAHLSNATDDAKASQDRLDEIADESDIFTTLLEAAEVTAALGGGYLRAGWDKELSDAPFITAVHADSALPEFRWGRMVAVTFWRIVAQQDERVWRHLERHELGRVLHGLYVGDNRHLGRPAPLTESPATADLVPYLTDGNAVETGLPDRLTAVYVPNMRPNRADRGSPLGRSDYAGIEGLMDSLDETYSSWMRDIRLGKGRIIVSKDYLHSEGKGRGAGFDIDREAFEALDVDPVKGIGITPVQFAIRTKDHADTAADLVERIVAGAGYSGSTFGLKGEGTIKTATEIAAREQLSLVTRAKKATYWQRPVREILTTLLMLDSLLFGGPSFTQPDVIFADSVRNDAKETATTVGLLRTAAAASTETLVRMVHPEWGDDQVATEVAAITDSIGKPPPTVGASPISADATGDPSGGTELPETPAEAVTVPTMTGGTN
jgi:A118 family predicted phage portal protein